MMAPRDGLAAVALASGVVVLVLCALGLLATRGAYARLHVAGPAAVLGMPLVALALLIGQGPTSASAIRGVLIAALGLAGGPVLAHAIARAERLRTRGELKAEPGEEAPAP